MALEDIDKSKVKPGELEKLQALVRGDPGADPGSINPPRWIETGEPSGMDPESEHAVRASWASMMDPSLEKAPFSPAHLVQDPDEAPTQIPGLSVAVQKKSPSKPTAKPKMPDLSPIDDVLNRPMDRPLSAPPAPPSAPTPTPGPTQQGASQLPPGPMKQFAGTVQGTATGGALASKPPQAPQGEPNEPPAVPMPGGTPFGQNGGQMEALQGQAREDKRRALAQEAAYALATGGKLSSDFFARRAALAGEPVTDFAQRVAFEQQELQRERQRQLMDPTSPTSGKMRDSLGAAAPEFRARFTDDQWNRLSANDLAGLGKPMETVLQKSLEEAKTKGVQTAEDARKQKELDAANQREQQRLEFEGKQGALNRASHERIAQEGVRAQGLSDKEVNDLRDDLDTNSRKAGNLRDNQNRLNAAERLKALAQNPDGTPRNLTAQQMQELATSLNGLVSGGNSGAAHEIDALVPKSARGDMTKIAQWVTNEPTGTGQQAFVKQMLETAEREKGVAADQIRQGQLSRLPAHRRLLEKDPDTFNAIVNMHGISPEEAAAAAHGQKAPPAPAQPHPQDNAAVAWAKAHPGDPRAKKILALNGG